jgi:hypothetical protein
MAEQVSMKNMATARQRLIATFGSGRGLLGWMLLQAAQTGQPTDITYFQRKPGQLK